MDRFQKLHVFVEDCLTNPSAAVAQKLQIKLERARVSLASLLDVPPKNQKERETLQKGSFTYLPTGTSYPVSESLVKEILLLSDTLGCSEDYAASLVSFGINAKARTTSSSRAESGLVVFLNERTALLRTLQAIWRGALSADEDVVSSGLQQIFERETEELLKATNKSAAGSKTWLQRLFDVLDDNQTQSDQLSAQASGQPSTALTLAGPSTATASISADSQQLRIVKLNEERIIIAQLFFLIGAAWQFDADSLHRLLQTASRASTSDSVSSYLLVAVMSAFDVSNEPTVAQLQTVVKDGAGMQKLKSLLDAEWSTSAFRAPAQLAFALFWEYAGRFIKTDSLDQADNLAWQAVQSGAFESLGRKLLSFKHNGAVDQIWSGIGQEQVGEAVEIESWFQDYVTDQVDLLVAQTITTKTSMLRKLRNREEDVVASSHRGGGHRSSRIGLEERSLDAGHHLEALFLLIATLYHDNDDGAMKFWDLSGDGPNRLAAFIRWGSESRPVGMMRSYYEMLASLASGPQCATSAFEFLMADQNDSAALAPASPSCSWSALFGALEFYQAKLSDRPLGPGANMDEPGEMPPEEVALLRSFIRLLRQVVLHSDVARATLYDSQRHRPVTTLFGLLVRPVPIELKASLLEALSAFARPGGTFGVEVAKNVWQSLEHSQILPTLAIVEGRDMRGGGIFTELEEVEAPNRVYPESTAFVQLLSELVHTPSSFENVRKGFEIDTHSIPDGLGAPHREPGIAPYTRFVVDDVLLKLGSRDFADSRERWRVNDECLRFIENCLASFDLEPLMSQISASPNSSRSSIQRLFTHPGFDLLLRLLANDDLLSSVMTIITAGIDSILSNKAGTRLFTDCMLRCLRIVNRVLDLQSPFLEVFLPALSDSGIPITRDRLARLKTVTPLDQLFLYHSEALVQTALLVGCEDDNRIALQAVNILSKIADSRHFDVAQRFAEHSKAKLNRLVGLLQSSSEALTIIDAFVQRLDEPVTESEVSGETSEPSIQHSIRAAILDMLLGLTQPQRHSPNLAHLVLGFNVLARAENLEVEDPDVPDVHRTPLHVVLDILARNVSSEEGVKDYEREPSISARCYKLVGQLCIVPYTSGALSRYLRNRERFFLVQSGALPFAVPSATTGSLGEVSFADGRKVITSCDAICSILAAQTSLMEAIALEVSVLAAGGDERRLGEIVKALLENPAFADSEAAYEKTGFEQDLPRLLEVFHSFDFAWIDEIDVSDARLLHLASVSFESCLRADQVGCLVYDFKAVLGLLVTARFELQNRGLLGSATQESEFKQEMKALIELLITDNHRRRIRHARFLALSAWRSLLDVVIVKALDLLPVDTRSRLVVDILSSVLPPLASQNADTAINDIFSGVAVLLMTRLREEGLRQAPVEGAAPLVSPERLHSVLRMLLQAIFQSGSSETARGNVYATLLNYLQYCDSARGDQRADAGAETMSVMSDDAASLDGSFVSSKSRSARHGPLRSGNLSILQSTMDRLIPAVCRDAVSGSQVWRTVAFTLLDALIRLAKEGRVLSKVLTIMTKQGFLQSFVSSIKDADAELQDVLRPDPASLNALYVYEAQMTFLIRLASSSEGAEKLFGADVLGKLAQCDFLGARPQAEGVAMELDGFLPPASERHHQLLCPALELVLGLLVSFAADTPAGVRQAMSFVDNQREVLLSGLRECATSPNLSRLREAHLIVSLLSAILPSVPDEQISAPSGFGGLHTATIALSARVCGPRDALDKIAPSNNAERDDDAYLVLSLTGRDTVFSDKLNETLANAQTAILTYMSLATRREAGSNAFRPVWLPTLDIPRSALPPATLGIATAFIENSIDVLRQRLSEASHLREKLDNGDLSEFEGAFDFSGNGDLTEEEKRRRIGAEVDQLDDKTRSRLSTSAHIVEVALLLFWRHLSFYLDPERSGSDHEALGRPDVGLGLAESLRARSSAATQDRTSSIFDRDMLRSHVADRCRSIQQKLARLDFDERTIPAATRSSKSFLELASRKISDVLRVD